MAVVGLSKNDRKHLLNSDLGYNEGQGNQDLTAIMQENNNGFIGVSIQYRVLASFQNIAIIAKSFSCHLLGSCLLTR